MGTSLYPLGNHKLIYEGKTLEALEQEIKLLLDQILFVNDDFLRAFALHQKKLGRKDALGIRKIKNKKDWTPILANKRDFFETGVLIFEGPFDLKLYLYKNKILFGNPSLSYASWFSMEDMLWRDEWRKYMYQVLKALGGDRVIYMATNTHPLEIYEFDDDLEALELELRQKYTAPQKTFKEMADEFSVPYFIDDFHDLDWGQNKSLEAYLPEPEDTADIQIDLDNYKTKAEIQMIPFYPYILLHKVIDDRIFFYHLALYEGLLCTHQGQIGESEKIDLKLDAEAPFTYVELSAQKALEGYTRLPDCNYSVLFHDDHTGIDRALKLFDEALLWNGIGYTTGSAAYHDGRREYYFYAAHIQEAIPHFIRIFNTVIADKVLEIIHIRGTDRRPVYQQ